MLTVLSQDSKTSDPAVNNDPQLTSDAAPFLRQLQEQNLAVLKAVERLQDDADAALGRYNVTVAAQLDALKSALVLQRAEEEPAERAPVLRAIDGRRVVIAVGFDRAQEAAPSDPDIYYLRGKIYAALGRYVDAVTPLRRARSRIRT